MSHSVKFAMNKIYIFLVLLAPVCGGERSLSCDVKMMPVWATVETGDEDNSIQGNGLRLSFSFVETEDRIEVSVDPVEVLFGELKNPDIFTLESFGIPKIESGLGRPVIKDSGPGAGEAVRDLLSDCRPAINLYLYVRENSKEMSQALNPADYLLTSEELGGSDLGRIDVPEEAYGSFRDDEHFYFLRWDRDRITALVGSRSVVENVPQLLTGLPRADEKTGKELVQTLMGKYFGYQLILVEMEAKILR